VFSAVLEYLYKGDYSPQLAYDKKRSSFYLSTKGDTGTKAPELTVQHNGVSILKDTAIYVRPLPFSIPFHQPIDSNTQCAAHRLALPHLQGIALKKQGLHSGVQTSTILSSARYAYLHTPANDSSLRAHYLALIIRSRATFKRSGIMQAEMTAGGSALWFDLFVAMVEHLVSLFLARPADGCECVDDVLTDD
jgi:hypothetical protein